MFWMEEEGERGREKEKGVCLLLSFVPLLSLFSLHCGCLINLFLYIYVASPISFCYCGGGGGVTTTKTTGQRRPLDALGKIGCFLLQEGRRRGEKRRIETMGGCRCWGGGWW